MTARVFGEIPGCPEGTYFASRLEASRAGIHRPTQAGISGSAKEGADSIVVSGGYEDDRDLGTEIVYTGHGGRDPETGEQVADQELTSGNLALVCSSQHGLPVRVVRGANPHSQFAPKAGYRYDGLYTVEEYWQQKGKSGHLVWCFRLKKINPESAPWKAALPADLTAKVKATTAEKTPAQKKPQPAPSKLPMLPKHSSLVIQKPPAATTPLSSFVVGDWVKHPVFGEGVVSGVAPSGQGDQIVTVDFPGVGSKKFLGSRANMEVVPPAAQSQS